MFFSVDRGRIFFISHIKRMFFSVFKEGRLPFLVTFPRSNVCPVLDEGASVNAPPKGLGYSSMNPELTPTTGHAPYGR